MRPDALIFDLDGTLWDTCEACAVAWNRALRAQGIAYRAITPADLRGVAGLPHADCIRAVFHDLVAEQHCLLEAHTAQGDMDAIRELGGELYTGVADGLRRLAERYPLYIVSNCQSGYIELFYSFSGLGQLFRDQACWGDSRQPKAINLAALIARHRLQSPVYIGDTQGDAEAAERAGVPFWHVSWGYGELAVPVRFASFASLLAHAL